MKTDMEILHEYVDEYNSDFYESLSTPEQILYLCQLRDTLPFILYLLRYRILEFASRLVKSMRKIKQKGIRAFRRKGMQQYRYLYKAQNLHDGQWVEGFLFLKRKSYDSEPYAAYIIQDAYEQIGTSIGKQNYGNHEVLVSVATEKKIDEGGGYYQVDINTICQCTGIPDKTREKLIFEHDILEGHLDEEHPEDITRVTVRWRKNKWLTIQEGAIENEELDDFCTEHYRIIGNELDMHN